MQCHPHGTVFGLVYLIKRYVLVVDRQLASALVENVVYFQRHAQLIVAESLIKLGVDIRGRFSQHIVFIATAHPLHIDVHPHVTR